VVRPLRRFLRPRDLGPGVEGARTGLEECPEGPGIPLPVPGSGSGLGREAHSPLLRRTAHPGGGRGRDLPQAGGPGARGRPQAEQCARAGTVGPAAREASAHRRDRGRTARRGHRDDRGEARAVHRGVHGSGGHGTPEAQRAEDAASRRHRPARDPGAADPEGGDQRGAPGLDRQRAGHPLPPGQRRGSPPLSFSGGGLPIGDRTGTTKAEPGPVGTGPDLVLACVGGGSNAIGTFHPLRPGAARLVGVEARGSGRALGLGGRPPWSAAR